LEITEGYYNDGGSGSGSSADYYYYFYDWEVSYDRICQSDVATIDVIVNSTSLEENKNTNSLFKVIDFLGRETLNKDFSFQIYDDGTVEKKIILE